MLRLMTILASGETLYCSRTIAGSLISSLRKSGSLAALSRISLMISASFCRESKYQQPKPSLYIILMHDLYTAAQNGC